MPSISGAMDYKVAKTIGQHNGNCHLNFPLCALNGTEILTIVDSFIP